MTTRLVPDELWAVIEPLFSRHRQSPKEGRRPVDNRTLFTSIVFLLKTGVGWRDVPIELGASSRTVRRRLKAWTDQGLLGAIAARLLMRLRAAGRLDLAEVLIVGGLLKAPSRVENAAQTLRIGAAPAASRTSRPPATARSWR